MKICLISFDNWGFNDYIAGNLSKEGHTVLVIDFSKFKHHYPNFLYRSYNGFLKFFFKKNIKTEYYGDKIIDKLKSFNEKQDVILTIKADFISPQNAIKLKEYTKKSVAFFNDSTEKCPKILNVINCFDEVYSFDKNDCRKYNLKFKTNFIYSFPKNNLENKYDLFNISSFDKRIKTITKIAKKLKELEINYKILILNSKKEKYDEAKEYKDVEFIKKPIPLNEIDDYLLKSKTFLDIQRKQQLGLTFRVFESLGYQKKLITTNPDIKNYDFYNPNNILVLDSKNPEIEKSFFETPYEKIPEKIVEKYTLTEWVKDIIKIK